MLVYVKTSNRKSAHVLQLDSGYLTEAINRWFQAENTLSDDLFWKFKLEVREQGTPVDCAIGDVITLKPWKRNLLNQLNNVLDEQNQQNQLTELGHYEIASSAVTRSFAELPGDNTAELIYNLRVKVNPTQMADFLAKFEDLLDEYHIDSATETDISDDEVDAALTEAQG